MWFSNLTNPARSISSLIVLIFISFPVLPSGQEVNDLKNQSTMELEWIREYTGDFEIQDARDIAVDNNGNVFIGITSFDTVSSYGFTLIKYSNEGETLWTRKYEGDYVPELSKSMDKIQDIAVDLNNNVYIVGKSEFFQSDPYDSYISFVTMKYDPQGELKWLSTFRIDSLNLGWYWPYIIAVDSLRNVYVSGNFEQAIMIKYDSLGNLLWDKNIESVSSVVSMILDEQSNIYLGKPDLSIMKYDSNGTLLWETQSDSLDGIDTQYGYISIDKQNNIYINGAHKTQHYHNKINYTVKYDCYGNLQWLRKYGKEGDYLWFVTAGCGIDDSENIYVSGNYWNEYNDESSYMVIKYDSAGNQKWVAEFAAPANTKIGLRKMAMDTAYNIYLIGSADEYDFDFALVKFDSAGNLLYSDFYGVSDRNEQASAIAIDGQQNIFITGNSTSSSGTRVFTLKYGYKPVSIESEINLLPNDPVLNQNYPNPFNSTTTISFSLPKTMSVNLILYNLLGQEVEILTSGPKLIGKHKIEFNAKNLASGIYIYRLESKEFTLSQKLLLMK